MTPLSVPHSLSAMSAPPHFRQSSSSSSRRPLRTSGGGGGQSTASHETLTESPIGEFYAGKVVLITGVSGFVGKVILEKLLHSAPDVRQVMVVIRGKRGVPAAKRLTDLLTSRPLTFRLTPEDTAKVVAIEGDIGEPLLGLSAEDSERLHDVNVVLHVAASVKFEAPLRENMKMNVSGVTNMLELSRKMAGLEAFIHVSTAYSNCQLPTIEERVYPLDHDVDTVIGACKVFDDAALVELQSRVMGGRPNTYTYTKAVAEVIVEREGANRGLPVAIVRPSIVMPCLREPVPGWVDSVNGPAGVSLLGGLGILQVTDMDTQKACDLIPCDYVANAVIAAGWYTAVHSADRLRVYNVTTSAQNPLCWYEYFNKGAKDVAQAPSIKTIRPVTTFERQSGTHPTLFRLRSLVHHLLFAHLMDLIVGLFGGKRTMVRIVQKMDQALGVFSYFYKHEWYWEAGNYAALARSMTGTRDAATFCTDVRDIDWSRFPMTSWMGLRRYLLKEEDANIPAARLKYRIICSAWTLGKIVFTLSSLFIAYKVHLSFF